MGELIDEYDPDDQLFQAYLMGYKQGLANGARFAGAEVNTNDPLFKSELWLKAKWRSYVKWLHS